MKPYNILLYTHLNPQKSNAAVFTLRLLFATRLIFPDQRLISPASRMIFHALWRFIAAPCGLILKKTVFLTQKKGFFRVKKPFFSNFSATGRRRKGTGHKKYAKRQSF
ncbi:MAG: hypothetical protein J6P44_02530 [Bacteroidales bacterium]|nr:hypothetical protein [Bacteroidales bacterium]